MVHSLSGRRYCSTQHTLLTAIKAGSKLQVFTIQRRLLLWKLPLALFIQHQVSIREKISIERAVDQGATNSKARGGKRQD